MHDTIIIGGGIAGLQAAIQLGRYCRSVLVIDANNGRSTRCRQYHNLLGWPEGVSGLHLRRLGTMQAQQHGVHFCRQRVVDVEFADSTFQISAENGEQYIARTLLLATGVLDNIPPIPGIEPALGLSIFVCPDCDGYECLGKRTAVLGSGDTGADMALMLLHWTQDIVYVNHGTKPISDKYHSQLNQADVQVIESNIELIEVNRNSCLEGILLSNGETIMSETAFVAFGGNRVESTLGARLGAACTSNGHIQVNPRTKMTSVPGLWAAGDVVAHSEQVSIALGDGSQAAIFIEKVLRGEPATQWAFENS